MIGSLVLPVLVLLVPVVLVFAFAGCEPFDADTSTQTPPPPPPPDNGQHPPGDGRPPTTTTPPAPMPGDPYRAEILKEPGLMGYWRLAETTGNIANDSGPNARGGVYKGGPTLGVLGALAAKQPGDTAVLFDGVGQLAEIAVGTEAGLAPGAPDLLLPPADFSLEAWVRLTPDAPGGGAADLDVVFDAAEIALAAGVVRGFQLYVAREASPPAIHGAVGRGTTGTTADDLTDEVIIELPTDVLGGTWAHLVLTFRMTGPVPGGAPGMVTGILTLYLSYLDSASGTPKRLITKPVTAQYARNQTTQTQPLRIGGGQDALGQPGSFFAGRIDEVALYNTVVPSDHVNAHFDRSVA